MNLTQFKSLPVPQREKEFKKWLKTQNPERHTEFDNFLECPLARFGKFITRKGKVFGMMNSFDFGDCFKGIKVISSERFKEKLRCSNSYKDLQ